MSLISSKFVTTIDESSRLQNQFLTPTTGDGDDNDILFASIPLAFSSQLASAGTPINAALSGYNGSNSGSAYTFTINNVSGVGFTDASGAALDGDDSGLKTVDGDSILLYTDTTNNILYGMVGSTIIFAAYLEEQGPAGSLTGAKLWMVQYEAIYHPDSTTPDDSVDLSGKVFITADTQREFSLANAPSGQNLYLMFGDSQAAIVVTGKNPANQSTGVSITTGDTVNTSQGGGGTTIGTNNQMIDPGEGMYFTFVVGANPNYTAPNLDQNEADIEADIDFASMLDAQAASFSIVQLQKGKTATVTITAMTTAAEKGNNYIDGLGISKGDSSVAIDFVQIRNAAGVVVEKLDINGNDAGLSSAVTISLSGGVATIVGVAAGYTIEYHTVADHNRVLIDNTGTGSAKGSFDIGGFTLLEGGEVTEEIGSQMHFEDDGPAISQATPTDTILLNTQDADTIGPNTDSDGQSFAAAFTIGSSSGGADGAGAPTWSYALSVGSPGMDSGLKSHGATIYLYLINSGKVVGSTATSAADVLPGNTVFDVEVDATGYVTLDQMMQIDHPLPGSSSDYAAQHLDLANGKISLTATALITDYDGDTASSSQTIDLGGNLRFDDHGPAISQAAPTDTILLNTQDADTIGPNTDSDGQSFAAAFTIGSSSGGADGAGAPTWSYALSVGSPGMDSGLKSHGATIYLYLINSGKVVGSTATSAADVLPGNTVFDVEVDAVGYVTLDQMMQIDHPLPGSSSNYAAQYLDLTNGKISLTATALITDYDGDTASSSQTIDLGGNLRFDDHGPAISQAAPTDTILLNTQDADTIGPNTDSDGQSFAAAFTIGSSSGGADGAGAPTWSYALSVGSPGMDSGLKSYGATIYLYLINSGKVVGSTATSAADVLPGNTVFDVEVDATGYVTLDQMTVIDHGIPGSLSDLQAVLENGKIYLTATALITDFDGDTASSAKTLDLGGNIKFDDALPFAVLAVPTAMTLLLTQDRDTIGGTDTAAVVYSTAFSEAGSDAGADTGGSINKSLALKVSNQGVDSGLTSHSATIYLYLIDSQTVVGSTSAVEGDIDASNTVFSILLESGSVKLEQMQAIDHELPGDTSNFEAQKAFIDDGKLWLEVTLSVTDFDNDVATVTKEFDLAGHMAFADDGPAAFSPASVSLQNTGTATATGDLHTGGDIADTIGADVEGSSIFVDGNSLDNYLYKTDGTTLLRSGGEKIVLSGFGTDTLTATTENTHQTVFTATLLFGSDQYTIDFDKAIDDGSGISFLGAAPVKSGNPTYNIINNVGGTTLDLLFSGTKNGAISSVNVSTTGAGVANQTMNAGESLRIDFGHDMVLTGSPNGSDFTSGSHQTVNGYSFLVSQNTPSGTTATAYIKVYDADNDKVLTGDPDDTVDTITQVKVNGILIYDTDPNTTLQPITVNGQTVTAFAYDGGVIITGLNEGATGDGTGGDDPRITVYTADGFNRVETTNYAGQTVNNTVLGGTDFDIGPAGVEQSVQGTEFAFQLPVQTVDYDGDLSPVELIGVNVTPV